MNDCWTQAILLAALLSNGSRDKISGSINGAIPVGSWGRTVGMIVLIIF